MGRNRVSVFTVLFATAIACASQALAEAESTEQEAEVSAPSETEQKNQNNRLRTLEGSKSPLSLQAQLSYSGSTVRHPFSEYAPNPGRANPPPVVKLSGLIQARYRLSEHQSIGAGGGVTTETPFQKPTNTTLADPTVDFATSDDWGSFHNRLDLQLVAYTNNYETKYLYAQGLTLSDDLVYKFGESGWTIGLTSAVWLNNFRGELVDGQDVRATQVDYGVGAYPLVEYQLTKRLNLRSVVGFQYEHVRSMKAWDLETKRIYETLGLGVAATENVFLYFFVLFYPSPLSGIAAEETSVGFSGIINLF